MYYIMKIGEKIKQLRKQRNISQEVLANHLGVSFQAVSKWETEATQPDVIMIPAIASFFGISCDELLDFNLYEIESRVEKIVDEHRKYLETDIKKSEQIIRNGLKKYPGNEVLLNCLINLISGTDRADEAINIAKALIESTKDEEIKIDAWRIMAEAYKAKGDYSLCKEAIEHIPEVYFSNLYVKAYLLEGEDKLEAATKEAALCFEHLVWMLEILSDEHLEKGEAEKAKILLTQELNLLKAFANDFDTSYTTSKYDPEKIAEIERKISML